MQYVKNEIRQRIIDAAREEFLAKGFEKASVRIITTKAKTSKSNLYNYFKDKDSLFYSVLEPTLFKIEKGLESAKAYNVPKKLDTYTKESQKFVIDLVTEFVSENLIEVKLLLFQSRGSSLETIKCKVVDAFSDLLYDWIKSINPDKEVSKFFLRCIANFYLSILEQMLIYLTTREEVEKAGTEFLEFVYHGWKGVLK